MADQQPVLPPGTPDFPFAWEAAGDEALSWEWDKMHGPNAVAPMSADYMLAIAQGFAYRYQTLGVPMDVLCRMWNGFPYFAARFGGPQEEVIQQNTAGKRGLIPSTAEYWNGRSVPELRESYGWIDAIDATTLPPDELAVAWDEAWRRIERAWRIHFMVIAGAYQVLEDLADRYDALVPDAPAGDALRLIQGSVSELQDMGDGLERLVDAARKDPELAARLRAGDHQPPTEGAFARELSSFLDRHGHLGQGWDDLALPSWGEEPERLLSDIAKQLDHPPERAADRRERLAQEGHRLLEGVRSSLADRPDELAEFELLLATAREIGPITETHNYWIDRMAQACIRRFVMRVANRLVADGVIGQAEDVFYLYRAEVPGILRQPRNMGAAVAERRREHERQRGITPPDWVGMPPEASGGRFDAPEPVAGAAEELRGAGASVGVVRGPARVTLGQEDFERVQAGDIIVCPSSNPSWVPLFSVAAGLVTDTGGVLSHAAVVAREFGLPAVVGTRDGTTRIADGRLVELDGSSGVVRLL
jgi:pyruvate,water dikinase